jgi:hypothetical protein
LTKLGKASDSGGNRLQVRRYQVLASGDALRVHVLQWRTRPLAERDNISFKLHLHLYSLSSRYSLEKGRRDGLLLYPSRISAKNLSYPNSSTPAPECRKVVRGPHRVRGYHRLQKPIDHPRSAMEGHGTGTGTGTEATRSLARNPGDPR